MPLSKRVARRGAGQCHGMTHFISPPPDTPMNEMLERRVISIVNVPPKRDAETGPAIKPETGRVDFCPARA
jgi:hypothetical protein